MINNRKSPIQDDYIEKYLAEKELNLTATLDAKTAYADADFVVIAAPRKAEINFSDLKPCGCGYKISFMRFYNRIIVLYQTNILVSHFIPQNRFR